MLYPLGEEIVSRGMKGSHLMKQRSGSQLVKQRSGRIATYLVAILYCVAILLTIAGVVGFVTNPNLNMNLYSTVEPTCNGQPMSPGDVCNVYRNDTLVRTETFADRSRGTIDVRTLLMHPLGWLLLGVILLTILLVMRYSAHYKKKKSARIPSVKY